VKPIAERAEAAQRETEAAVQELSAALARFRSDLDITRRELAKKSARAAQQRATEANAKIEHIVEAIRTQLPSREDLSAPV